MAKLIELDKVLEIVKSYFSIDYAFQDFILNEISKLPTTEINEPFNNGESESPTK